jgi:hypothetical protein
LEDVRHSCLFVLFAFVVDKEEKQKKNLFIHFTPLLLQIGVLFFEEE